MAKFQFPQTFMANGKTWHLQYEPGNPRTVLPSLDGGKVTDLVCDAMPAPGGKPGQVLYVVRVDVTLPSMASDGRVMGEKHLRGVRAYEMKPVSPEMVPPREMAFYLEEMPEVGMMGETECFMLGLLGVASKQMKPEVDTAWAERLLSDAVPKDAEEDPLQDAA